MEMDEKIQAHVLSIWKENRGFFSGTGKTLVVKKVLNQIQNRVDKNSYRIKIATTNAKDQSNLYNVLVDLGRQLGLKGKKTPDDKLWLPSTGLSISEVFNRILYVIEKNKINTVFVIDEIDHLAKLVDKTGKDILYSITRTVFILFFSIT